VEMFLAKFEKAAVYNRWTSADKAAHLPMCLVGPAENLLWNAMEDTYDELVVKLRRRYGTREQQEKFRLELKYRKRKSSETLQELAIVVEKLTKLAYPEANSAMIDALARDAFIDALDDSGLQLRVRENVPPSLDAA